MKNKTNNIGGVSFLVLGIVILASILAIILLNYFRIISLPDFLSWFPVSRTSETDKVSDQPVSGDLSVSATNTDGKVVISWDPSVDVYTLRVTNTNHPSNTAVFLLSNQPVGKRIVITQAVKVENDVLPKALYPAVFLPNPYTLGTVPDGYLNNASSSPTQNVTADQFLKKGVKYRIEMTGTTKDRNQDKKGVYEFTY